MSDTPETTRPHDQHCVWCDAEEFNGSRYNTLHPMAPLLTPAPAETRGPLAPLLTMEREGDLTYMAMGVRAIGDSALQHLLDELAAQRAEVVRLTEERDEAIRGLDISTSEQERLFERTVELQERVAAIYAKVRALPEPMCQVWTGSRRPDSLTRTLVYDCDWCDVRWPEGRAAHPDNGCLWREAQQEAAK